MRMLRTGAVKYDAKKYINKRGIYDCLDNFDLFIFRTFKTRRSRYLGADIRKIFNFAIDANCSSNY